MAYSGSRKWDELLMPWMLNCLDSIALFAHFLAVLSLLTKNIGCCVSDWLGFLWLWHPSTFPSSMLTRFSVNFSAVKTALLRDFLGVLWDTSLLSLINVMHKLPRISLMLVKNGFGNLLVRSKLGLKPSTQSHKCLAQSSRRIASVTGNIKTLGRGLERDLPDRNACCSRWECEFRSLVPRPKAGVMAHLCNVSSRGLAGRPQGLADLASPAEPASCRFSERRVSKSKVEEGDVAQGLRALTVLVEFSGLLPSTHTVAYNHM